jgi:hypothetical protein
VKAEAGIVDVSMDVSGSGSVSVNMGAGGDESLAERGAVGTRRRRFAYASIWHGTCDRPQRAILRQARLADTSVTRCKQCCTAIDTV